jgi:hypothetical protein
MLGVVAYSRVTPEDLPQPKIDGAEVILWTPIDSRHRATGACQHFHEGQLAVAVSWVAICRYDEAEECYLFAIIRILTATQIRFTTDRGREAASRVWYEGVSKTWISAT